MNSSQNTSQDGYCTVCAVFITTFGFILILWIILGNLLVIFAVLTDPKLRRQNQHRLIVSMATADLLVGLVVIPLTLGYEIVGQWKLGTFLCELWLALDVLFVTSSILHICVIALDRYWSISSPTCTNKRSAEYINRLAASAWLFSLLICLPPLVGWRPEREAGQCTLSTDIGYVMYSALGSFFVPVFVVLFAYKRIYYVTRARARQRRRDALRSAMALTLSQMGPPSMDQAKLHRYFPTRGSEGRRKRRHSEGSALRTGTSTVRVRTDNPKSTVNVQGEILYMLQTQNEMNRNIELRMKHPVLVKMQQQELKRRERQALLVLGVILAAFILGWLPFFVLYVLSAFAYRAPELVFKVCFWLGYCNSGVNPLIYTAFNPQFKEAIKRVLRNTYAQVSQLIHGINFV